MRAKFGEQAKPRSLGQTTDSLAFLVWPAVLILTGRQVYSVQANLFRPTRWTQIPAFAKCSPGAP